MKKSTIDFKKRRMMENGMIHKGKIIIESTLTLIIGLALLGAVWVAAIVLVGEK